MSPALTEDSYKVGSEREEALRTWRQWLKLPRLGLSRTWDHVQTPRFQLESETLRLATVEYEKSHSTFLGLIAHELGIC